MHICRDIGLQSLVFFDKKSQNFFKTGFLDELSHLESKNKKKIFHFFLTQVDSEKTTKSQKKFFFSKKISRSIFSTNWAILRKKIFFYFLFFLVVKMLPEGIWGLIIIFQEKLKCDVWVHFT